MPTPSFDTDFDATSLSQIVDLFIKNNKLMNYMLANLDNKNIVNVAGFLATATEFKSKNGEVGFSSADPGDPDAIRLWAGSDDPATAPFRVQENGYMYSTRGFIGGWDISDTMLSGTGIIQGGTLRTAGTGARIEISNNSLKTYNASNNLSGFQNGLTPSGTTYGDAFFYSDGTEALRIYNTITNGYAIFPMNGFSMALGISGANTFARGPWTFDTTITGRIQYANQADSALSASSAQSVDWANVTNHPDGTSNPLMDGSVSVGTSALYSRQDHRHPTDTSRQATITGAATTITISDLTVSRALASDSSGKVAVSAVTSTEQGYLSGVTSAIQTQLNTKATVLSGGTKIESGTAFITVTQNAWSTVTINFAAGFSSAPVVTATWSQNQNRVYISITNKTAASCTLNVYNLDGSGLSGVDWHAIAS